MYRLNSDSVNEDVMRRHARKAQNSTVVPYRDHILFRNSGVVKVDILAYLCPKSAVDPKLEARTPKLMPKYC